MTVAVENLLINMSGGLLPEHLQEDEIKALSDKYGENWFESLGYTEPEYKKPKTQVKIGTHQNTCATTTTDQLTINMENI